MSVPHYTTTDEPQPDYSDDDNDDAPTSAVDDDKEEDYVELRKTVKSRISAMLTREQWDQILDKAGLEKYEGTAASGCVTAAHLGCAILAFIILRLFSLSIAAMLYMVAVTDRIVNRNRL